MKIRNLSIAGALAVTLVATGCGKEGTPGGSAAGACGPPAQLVVANGINLTDSPTFARISGRGHVVVGVKADQPGLAYKDASGNRCGFDVEIARLMSAGLGFDPGSIEYKEIPSANREAAIQAGEVDYYVGSYTINDKRKEQISFAGPYIIAGQSLLVRKDEKDITGKDTLKGKKVCSATGTTSIQRVRDMGLTEPGNIVEFKTGSECVSQLLDGKVDTNTTDDAILKGYAAASPDELKLVGETFSEEKYGIGLALTDKPLREAMNDVLAKAAADGTWQKLYDSTLGKSGIPAVPPAPERY
ncbi:glutamate ABC transporter substrate-binding protein [Saccharopolyspora elongata]|uniref:Glutamate ABC transporter substrate-binding protein n=1 Tax=Saccharopolyspora elongata TaxID=2530387 RepID=A0A4R4XNM2_9PSEU|nr:glutamate ABC transporter substrate-binding protein [Saccharopolyspora elongata]TDD32640.1 glutamate ABC transporter substrate-binding protein [Saccharopolyspora elongata]